MQLISNYSSYRLLLCARAGVTHSYFVTTRNSGPLLPLLALFPFFSEKFSSVGLKGQVSLEFDVISKPKNVCMSTETKRNCLVLL